MNKRKKARVEVVDGFLIDLNLRNHCLFCLQPHPPDELKSLVGKGIRPFELLRYFFIEIDQVPTKTVKYAADEDIFGNSLPPTCQSCFNYFEELQKLHQQLLDVRKLIESKVGKIREVVSGASSSSRDSTKWHRFTNDLSSCGLSGKQVTLTCELVKNLQLLISGRLEICTKKHQTINFHPEQSKPSTFKDDLKNENKPGENYETLSSIDEPIKLEDVENVEELGVDCEMKKVDDPGSIIYIVPSPLVDATMSEDDESDTSSHGQGAVESNSESDDQSFQPNSPSSEEQEIDFDWEVTVPRKTQQKYKYTRNPRNRRAKWSKIQNGDGVLVPSYQNCDLCGVRVPISDILVHVQGHVQGYATKCQNPSCLYVYSCQVKMFEHMSKSRTCKLVVSVESARESKGLRNCELCNLRCDTTYDLWKHVKCHETEMEGTSATKKECPLQGCNESFYLNQSVEYHLSKHNLRSPTKQTCSECGQAVNISEMGNHLTAIHQAAETFKCNYCGFQFSKVTDKIKHVYSHKLQDGVSCDICGKDTIKMERLVTLQQHYFNVHKLGKSSTVVCQYCGKDFFSAASLKYHIRKLHPDMEVAPTPRTRKSHRCNLCPQECASSDAMVNHKIKMHGGAHLPCKTCGDTFSSMTLLRSHLKKHVGTDILIVYKCNVDGCGKEYNNRGTLRIHEKSCHWDGNQKPYVCEICGKGYRFKSSLKQHTESTHLGIRHICETCGEGFVSIKVLKRHKLIHTGERPHICTVCGQAFRQDVNLKTHMKSHVNKGDSFKPNGPMKQIRKRVQRD